MSLKEFEDLYQEYLKVIEPPQRIARLETIKNQDNSWTCVIKKGYIHDNNQQKITLNQLINWRNTPKTNLTEILTEFKRIFGKGSTGKWIGILKSEGIQGVWDDISKSTVSGELGIYSKLSATESGRYHIVEIQTIDCTDLLDVYRVLKAVKKVCKVDVKWKYKPEIFTQAGVYYHNEFKIDPIIYRDYMFD
jgi:hypothetical protein